MFGIWPTVVAIVALDKILAVPADLLTVPAVPADLAVPTDCILPVREQMESWSHQLEQERHFPCFVLL